MGFSPRPCATCLALMLVLASGQNDASDKETEVHISAQEDVAYVGDDISFVCTVHADAKPVVNWFMYERDLTGEPFAIVKTSESSSPSGANVAYSSTLTIKNAQFNHTSIVRCQVRLGEDRIFHLSTPMTISQKLDGKKLIGEPCAASTECEIEHSVCQESPQGEGDHGPRLCQCDDAHPVYSSLEMRCLEVAKLDQACVDSAQCASIDNGSHCEEHVCRCRTGFSAESSRCVAKADSSTCLSTSACVDSNAECVEGRCVCKAGYVLNPGSHHCEDSGEQEFQLAIIGVSAVVILLVLSGVTAVCYIINRRKEAGVRY